MNNINNVYIKKTEMENFINSYIDFYHENKEKLPLFEFTDNIIKPKKEKIHIKINSIENIQKSFIHSSFWNIYYDNDENDSYCCKRLDKNIYGDYEKAELHGDNVIDLITLDYLLVKFPDKDVGFLSSIKSKIVEKKSLSVLSEKLDLKKYILYGNQMDKINKPGNGRKNKNILEDIFESFVGKLYIDQNHDKDIIKPFLLGIYLKHIDLEYLINHDDNYKTTILKYFHSNKFDTVKYTELYCYTTDNKKIFSTVILLDKKLFDSTELSRDTTLINKMLSKKNNILNIITEKISDCNTVIQTPYTETSFRYITMKAENHYILGIGDGVKKQDSEQEAAKDCLILFGQL